MYFTILRTSLPPIQRFIKKNKTHPEARLDGSPKLRVWSQFAAMPFNKYHGMHIHSGDVCEISG